MSDNTTKWLNDLLEEKAETITYKVNGQAYEPIRFQRIIDEQTPFDVENWEDLRRSTFAWWRNNVAGTPVKSKQQQEIEDDIKTVTFD